MLPSFPRDGGVVANMGAFQAVVPSSILGHRMHSLECFIFPKLNLRMKT